MAIFFSPTEVHDKVQQALRCAVKTTSEEAERIHSVTPCDEDDMDVENNEIDAAAAAATYRRQQSLEADTSRITEVIEDNFPPFGWGKFFTSGLIDREPSEEASQTDIMDTEAIIKQDLLPSDDGLDAFTEQDMLPSDDELDAFTEQDLLPPEDESEASTEQDLLPLDEELEAFIKNDLLPPDDELEAFIQQYLLPDRHYI